TQYLRSFLIFSERLILSPRQPALLFSSRLQQFGELLKVGDGTNEVCVKKRPLDVVRFLVSKRPLKTSPGGF
ncbi:TPA: hypothetical protein ACGO0M_002105, partial [Streptococcus suis]